MLLTKPELSIAVILGNIILPPQGRDNHGILRIPDSISLTSLKKLINRLRGIDESVGVTVSKTNDEGDESLSPRENPFFNSSSAAL